MVAAWRVPPTTPGRQGGCFHSASTWKAGPPHPRSPSQGGDSPSQPRRHTLKLPRGYRGPVLVAGVGKCLDTGD